MKLSENQKIQIVKNPRNAQAIQKGRNHESRLRLFTECKFKDDLCNSQETAWSEFILFMQKAITDKKADRITDFIQYPLSSIGITESILNDLYRVFEAGNSYFEVETVKMSGGEEMQALLVELDIVEWIKEVARGVLKNKPNTAIVIDKDLNGKPYPIAVDNDRIIDVKLKDNYIDCEYIVFKHSEVENGGITERRFSVYDDETYSVVLEKGGVYTLEMSVEHEIGYCPARMFINERLNRSNEFNRKAPLTVVLSKLQEWQYFDVYKFYIDHTAPFPTTEQLKAQCGSEHCNNGYIETENVYFEDNAKKSITNRSKCKACEELNTIALGGRVLISPTEDGEKTAAGVFKYISPETSNLEYIAQKLAAIEEYIIKKIVGVETIVTKEAVNEKQMDGAFESKTNVLLRVKNLLEDVYFWTVSTMGEAYIKGKPLRIHGDFGTEWYLSSEKDLQERFTNAKTGGLPRAELDMIYFQLLDTKYKTNPSIIQKMKLINSIDPTPYDTTEEKIKKFQNKIISLQEFIISERISTFVSQFEAEQGSIIKFGIKAKESDRRKTILEKFKSYADEIIKQTADNEAEPIGSSKGTNV